MLQEQDLLNSLQLAILQSLPAQKSEQKPGPPKSFTFSGQFTLGLRATKPLSDPTHRIPWARDARTGLYQNLEAATTANAEKRGNDVIKGFQDSIKADQALLSASESLVLVTHEIGACIYAYMLRPIEELDTTVTLNALGVDSLVTIEIRNWWRRSLGVDVSTLEMLNAGSIDALGVLAIERLKAKYAAKDGDTENGTGGDGAS
jgi:hypothetical protein